jgi:hypothetical protein
LHFWNNYMSHIIMSNSKRPERPFHRVQTWLGYHIWTIRTHSKDFQIHLFLHFSHDVLHFTFFLMSNEITLFQILYRLLKYLFFIYENVNNKIYPMWAMFYQWPKIPKKNIFWNLLHYINAFGFCHIHAFYTH